MVAVVGAVGVRKLGEGVVFSTVHFDGVGAACSAVDARTGKTNGRAGRGLEDLVNGMGYGTICSGYEAETGETDWDSRRGGRDE